MGHNWALAKYFFVRAGQGVLLLFIILLVMFSLVQLAPGDPVDAMMGDFPAPDAYKEELREKYGLNDPIWKQFALYVGALFQGDLGYSFANNSDVSALIAEAAPNTILLMGTAIAISALVGIPFGAAAAYRPGSKFDHVVSSAALAGYAMPVFWLGQLLLLAFGLKLAILPVGGMESLRAPSEGIGRLADIGVHLILPALALSFRYVALFLRVTRASMLEVYRMDFVLTARSKGLGGVQVASKHVFRNAVLPVVTIIGYELGFILSGSVLVETVFSWPGLGQLLYTAIGARDTPTILGVFLIFTTGVVIANLLTDVMYARLDPRVSLQGDRRVAI